MAWGDLIEWKIWRARRGGTFPRAPDDAAYEARSSRFHSHSRFCRNSKLLGKVSVFSVVSIWKILTPASAMKRPMRQFDECSSDAGASMKDFECSMVCGLWWCRSDR